VANNRPKEKSPVNSATVSSVIACPYSLRRESGCAARHATATDLIDCLASVLTSNRPGADSGHCWRWWVPVVHVVDGVSSAEHGAFVKRIAPQCFCRSGPGTSPEQHFRGTTVGKLRRGQIPSRPSHTITMTREMTMPQWAGLCKILILYCFRLRLNMTP